MSGPRPTAALTVSVLGSVRHRAAARLPAWASGVFKCEYRCVRSAPARPGALLVLRVRGSGFRTEQVLFNSGIGGVPLSKTPLGHSRAYFRRHVWNAAPDADTARQSGAAFLGRRLSGSLTRRLPCTLPGLSLSLCWAGSWPKCTRRVKTCRAAWTQTSTSSAAPRDCGVSSGGRGEEGAHRRVFSPDSSSFLSRPLRHGDV